MGRVPGAPFLYAIVDLGRVPPTRVGATVRALALAGAELIQLRGKGRPDGVLLAASREGLNAARAQGVPFVVNDRADVALIIGADGVHVGQQDLPAGEARRLLGAGAIVGLSTHSLEQAEQGMSEPIDYLAVGPVFPTTSKADPDPMVGTGLVSAVRARTALPLVGIGGIRPENVRQVVDAGASGVAVISGLRAEEIEGIGPRVAAYLAGMKVRGAPGVPGAPS